MKKIFFAALALIILFVPFAVSAADSSANSKLIQMEKDTYGAEQTGAILDRISRLEKEYFGKNSQGNMNTRIDSVYNILYGNMGEPSILAKINAIEWNAYHEVSGVNITARLEKLESEILGKNSSKNLIKRINDLSQASFGNKKIPLAEMQIPGNTLIKVALAENIGSRNLQSGDIIEFQVAENVILEGKLIFAKGQRGKGIVSSVRKAKGWTGVNGKIQIDFQTLNCIDGNTVSVYVGTESKNAMKVQDMVDGASLVGMNLNDDWNKFMVHGKNLEIPAGTEFYVQTKKIVNIYGLRIETAG